ncbi:cytochrome P450 [Aspergillus pseudotamarii]|uniref:Cytochrome P450 n=1 Tax=Aspergillus pseudotamarii TaxID=132259 RepID=A0A5N6SMU0_ASPPS|nr:cytochrome P450 [Aspergillus pseudotamarii]KAE8135207.1 cytochrome P450 [Aspergillus pseudotamarii]
MASLLSISVVAVVVLRLLWTLAAKFQHGQRARRWGCAPFPTYPSDLLGIGLLKEGLTALKADVICPMFERRIAHISAREGRYVTTCGWTILGRETCFTIDPENIQAAWATQFKDFVSGDLRSRFPGPLGGNSIITTDGEEWARHRAILRPQFSRSQVSDLDLYERHLQQAMLAIPVTNGKWTEPLDILEIFCRLTIDSATEFLFGKSTESQISAATGKNTGEADFAHHLDKFINYAGKRVRLESLYWLANNQESRFSENEVQKYVDRYVQDAINAHQAGKLQADPKRSPQYIFLHALTAVTQDPIELRTHVLSLLVAGRDTTSSLLGWTVLLLARHPDEFQKLRHAILKAFGPYDTPNNLTFESLKACSYLQYCLNESLRLYPVAPFNRRVVARDTTLPRGGGRDGRQPIYVRKGQLIMVGIYSMHRRKDIWGPDADDFKPGRWEGRKISWGYLPFSGGPRVCIGQQLALTEAGYVLVRLIQRFDGMQDVNAEKEIKQNVTLTSAPAQGVTVRLHAPEA